MVKIKAFSDLIAVWSVNLFGGIVGFAVHDLVDVATLVKEIFAILAFGAALYLTILKIIDRKKKK